MKKNYWQQTNLLTWIKKLKPNGTSSVQIKSLHGVYSFDSFDIQRFKPNELDVKSYSTVLGGFDKTYQSVGLREFESRYANKLSYRELENLVTEQTGSHVYTCTQLQRKVKAEAVELSKELQSSYQGIQLCFPFVNTALNLYDENIEETLFFDDGIGVKRQKDKREDESYEKPTKRIISDIFAIQKPSSKNSKNSKNEMNHLSVDT